MSHRLHTLQSDALGKNEDICHRECSERATYKEKGREGKCFPVIFKLPEELRQDLTCHNTSWNVCVCVHSSLSTRVCLLCGEGSRREVEKQFQS